jgi:hypothetical protein
MTFCRSQATSSESNYGSADSLGDLLPRNPALINQFIVEDLRAANPGRARWSRSCGLPRGRAGLAGDRLQQQPSSVELTPES